jgi:hypothetical protein
LEHFTLNINVLNEINLNYELISLKFKYDYFKNWLFITIGTELNQVDLRLVSQ